MGMGSVWQDTVTVSPASWDPTVPKVSVCVCAYMSFGHVFYVALILCICTCVYVHARVCVCVLACVCVPRCAD